jgi:hypothetical protein
LGCSIVLEKKTKETILEKIIRKATFKCNQLIAKNQKLNIKPLITLNNFIS